jgi:pimeloyl-ACP methyl ester carboxylesterase
MLPGTRMELQSGCSSMVDAPAAVHTLALLEAPSISVPAAGEFAQSAEPIGQRFASGDKEGAVDDFLTAVGDASYRDSLDRLLPGAYEQAAADADTFFTVEFPALMEWGFNMEDAKRIDAPVLRVLGDRSIPWFVESDALLGEWLPHNESAQIAGANHLLQMGDPAPVADALATFFGRHPMT